MTSGRWVALVVVVALVLWFAASARRLSRKLETNSTNANTKRLPALSPNLDPVGALYQLRAVPATDAPATPFGQTAYQRLVAAGLIDPTSEVVRG